MGSEAVPRICQNNGNPSSTRPRASGLFSACRSASFAVWSKIEMLCSVASKFKVTGRSRSPLSTKPASISTPLLSIRSRFTRMKRVGFDNVMRMTASRNRWRKPVIENVDWEMEPRLPSWSCQPRCPAAFRA